MVGFEDFQNREEIEEWVLIEKKEEGLCDVIAQGSFELCRNAARLYDGEYDISLVPYEEFAKKARPLH